MSRATASRAANRRALTVFVIMLVLLVASVGVVVAWFQARMLRGDAEAELRTEIALLGELAVEPLLRSDYAGAERLIKAWIRRHDDLIRIAAVMPNGFVLTEFHKDRAAQGAIQVDQEVAFEGRRLMMLRAVADPSSHQVGVLFVVFKASAVAIVMVLLLGWVLWITLQRTAIRPLEAQIRQREAREQELRRRTSELEAAIQEIESFSYSVSHDLRAPLRAIDGFSRVLLEDHAAQLDTEARAALERVLAAVRRMGKLIDDLLELARVGRSRMEHGTVDLSALAVEAVEHLRAAVPSRDVQVDITPGLQVTGDERLLRQLVQNLLGNAWKYTGKTAAARIEFGRRIENGEAIYFVRDNGAGFDIQYVHKLFRPFQRLHAADEFEGTGVGLATVARIVHRHGGRVWAEAEVGRGACFFFTLP